MKKNGFMLIETLVASTIILGALIFLFVQFSAIKRSYEISFKYNTIPGLYNTKVFVDLLEKNGHNELDKALDNSNSNYIVITQNNCDLFIDKGNSNLCSNLIKDISSKKILYLNNNITQLHNNLKTSNYDNTIFDEELKKYILQLDKIDYNGRRVVIQFNNNTFAVATIN